MNQPNPNCPLCKGSGIIIKDEFQKQAPACHLCFPQEPERLKAQIDAEKIIEKLSKAFPEIEDAAKKAEAEAEAEVKQLRYEYNKLYIDLRNEKIVEILDDLGKRGWKLVSVIDDKRYPTYAWFLFIKKI